MSEKSIFLDKAGRQTRHWGGLLPSPNQPKHQLVVFGLPIWLSMGGVPRPTPKWSNLCLLLDQKCFGNFDKISPPKRAPKWLLGLILGRNIFCPTVSGRAENQSFCLHCGWEGVPCLNPPFVLTLPLSSPSLCPPSP